MAQAQVQVKRHGRPQAPPLSRPRSLNDAMAEAVDAVQRRAREAQAHEAARRPRPAAERIIEKLSAIERHVGIPPATGNFQGAELRIRTNAERAATADQEQPRWAVQSQGAHALISAIGARLDALEARLEVVLTPAEPATPEWSAKAMPATLMPATKLQAEQDEVIRRLHMTLEQLDGVLARINL